MGYVDYEYYRSLYGEKAIPEADFNRLALDACRKLDIATTGIDNVKKLKVAFPVDEYDAETIRRCVCELINISYKLEQSEENARSVHGYITREDGTVTNKQVSSVSAGNESISYVTSGNSSSGATLIDKALSDKDIQERIYRDTIMDYLSGVSDANGVNLLFMGPYPFRLEDK